MTPLCFDFLRILSDGKFHSGAGISQALSVSRSSLSNAAKKIEAAGIAVGKIRGKGYRLLEPIEWLDRDFLSLPFWDVEIAPMLDSTNSALSQSPEAAHGKVLACEWQTAGRGRLGKSWQSNLGGSLTFSILWRFNAGASSLSGLSLAVGIALIRALKSFGIEAALKWPNDILHNYRKLAGILIEAQGDMLGPTKTVIGIGINFKLSDRQKEKIDQAVTDIKSISGGKIGRNELFKRLLAELALVLNEFEKNGLKNLKGEWESFHAHQNKAVKLKLPDGAFEEGVACGISEKGELILRNAKGILPFGSAEISLRKP